MRGEISVENLVRKLLEIDDEDERFNSARAWLAQQNSVGNLIKILPVFKNELTRTEFVGEWFRENKGVENLIAVLGVTEQKQVAAIVKKWLVVRGNNLPLESPPAAQFQRKAPDLDRIFAIASEPDRPEITNAWLEKNNSAENVVKILPKLDPIDRIHFAKDWLTRKRNSDADFVQVFSAIKTELGSESKQLEFLRNWLCERKENNLSFEAVQDVLGGLASISEIEKLQFLREEWFLQKNNNAAGLIQFLSTSEVVSTKVYIVKTGLI